MDLRISPAIAKAAFATRTLLIIYIKQSQRMLSTGAYIYIWLLSKAAFAVLHGPHGGPLRRLPDMVLLCIDLPIEELLEPYMWGLELV